MRSVRTSISLALGLFLSAAASAGPEPSTAPQTQTSGRILLANVVDMSGKTQVDFGVDDFVIKEAGDEREVLDVHIADYPIVVLIDDDPQANHLEPIKAAIARFVARVGERPVAVGTLSAPTEFVATLENTREELLERLEKMTTRPETPSTLPSVAHAARVLQDTGSPFSAILVVTGRAID